MLKRDKVEGTSLGIIQLVKEESWDGKAPGGPMTPMKLKWDQALASTICVVLKEFDDVFP